MGIKNLNSDDIKASIVLAGIGSTILVVTIYHCIATAWCRHRRHRQGQRRLQVQQQAAEGSQLHSLELASFENSTAELIPVHKYQKGMGLVDDDGMCAVCLSQFEEGEELKTLPECLHSYHAPCIDMWLYSHLSCPMCRADATPSPQLDHHQPSDTNPSTPANSHSIRLGSSTLRNIVQPRVL